MRIMELKTLDKKRLDYKYYMDIWQSITKKPTPDSSIPVNQKALSHPLQVIAVEVVLSAAQTQTSLARLIAAAAPSSGAFLQVIPMSSVGTRLSNTSMLITVSLRLGAALCTPHNCICGMAVDSSGVYGLSCRKSAGQPVAVPDTRLSIELSRPLCPQRKCQVVLNQEDLLVTTANDIDVMEE